MNSFQIPKTVDQPMGYRSFCEWYLGQCDKAEKERKHLLGVANNADKQVKSAQSEMEDIQKKSESLKAEFQKGSQAVEQLNKQKNKILSSQPDYNQINNQEHGEIEQIENRYQQEKNNLQSKVSGLIQDRNQNQPYFDTLKAYGELYARMCPYRDEVHLRMDHLMQKYPSLGNELSTAVSGPVTALTQEDFNFEYWLESGKDDSDKVMDAVKIPDIIKYIISPEGYSFGLLTKKDFLLTRVLSLVCLVLAVLGGIFVSPVMIPVLLVVILGLLIRLKNKHNRLLSESVNWPLLRVYNTILNFREEDIEPLARKAVNLPSGSSLVRKQEASKTLQDMKNQVQELEATIQEEEKQIANSKQRIHDLQDQLEKVNEPALRANSRLNAALKKRKSGLELTTNQMMIVEDYEEQVDILQGQINSERARNSRICSSMEEHEDDLNNLRNEIVAYQKQSKNDIARLEQIERVTGENGQMMQARLASLDQEKQEKIRAIHQKYEEKRQEYTKWFDKKREQLSLETDEKIQKAEEKLSKINSDVNELENQKVSYQLALQAGKDEAESTQTDYEKQKALSEQWKSAEVWKECVAKWKTASSKAVFSDIHDFNTADACYVIGPEKPYLITHNNRPVVLLYDYDKAKYPGMTPSEILKNTIGAIAAGIQMSSLPGLTEFAVVNEYSDDSSYPAYFKCYGKTTLEELNSRVDSMRESLQKETQYGHTVKTFNQEYSTQMLKNGVANQSELLKLMKKTLYVFVLPTPDSDQYPLHNERIWEKIRGNCYDYGFVPVFFITSKQWDEAGQENAPKNGFCQAVNQLKGRASIHKIPLNEVTTH